MFEKLKKIFGKLKCEFSCCNSVWKLEKNNLVIKFDDLQIQISELENQIEIVKKSSIDESVINEKTYKKKSNV